MTSNVLEAEINQTPNKERIENSFGKPLVWEELPDNKMSRIKIEMGGVSLYEDGDWNKMNDFLINNLPKFENAFKDSIEKLK